MKADRDKADQKTEPSSNGSDAVMQVSMKRHPLTGAPTFVCRVEPVYMVEVPKYVGPDGKDGTFFNGSVAMMPFPTNVGVAPANYTPSLFQVSRIFLSFLFSGGLHDELLSV